MITKAKFSQKNCLAASIALLGLSASMSAFAAPTSGKLLVINNLANYSTSVAGTSGSTVNFTVSDSTGVCNTTNTLALGGVATISWDSTKTHSSTQCTGIVSVSVTTVKSTVNGFVQYDSTATTPSAAVTAATTASAPTTAVSNLVLIITGNAGAALNSGTADATNWGAAAGTAPVYNTGNGMITTTGVPSFVGMKGLQAAKVMYKYGIIPSK